MTLLSILLNGFVPKVKTGDKVIVGQVIAERNTKRWDEKGDLGKLLGVSPQKVSKYLTRRPGDRVEKGTVIAVKKGTLGIGTKKIESPIAGTVFKFDGETGFIYIRGRREDAETENLFSPVDGVVELCDNKKIVIKTDKEAILADKVSGKGIVWAETILLGEDEVGPDSIGVDPASINGKIRGKIILGKVFQREAISKALGIGALGIISQNISDEELEDLAKKNINAPIFIINEENFEKLSRYNGEKIYMDCEKKAIIIYEGL
ncbi:MAG: hypothetical protein A3H50_00900 [Candidatus Levybacteria bacterium RIFCSPLOWO2_02_FULL_37_10]|nr:MAG: hypothetical protein A2860_03460 [Candidatus Levybacteria bacterium RIFCSPHIGHO2_01_FULL_37_33]OGH16396.1 MAG: hypothetical protein A3C97_02685 [Candidatus Levybacteria bacterium RIFCSPHIGHO2_02_FULL_37_11]OGH30294.1 MAG: hypothetical protein A3F30_03515 [Candidatus Levybacteria bacterium RIFCSPHIGHO2_12_FULL_37_12]OGH43161.1 MAG: hypothetical protein A3H50_00900 [Candidatus Levybacteria bacterium RIFCSPLOWO2_02_FULL_37_10]